MHGSCQEEVKESTARHTENIITETLDDEMTPPRNSENPKKPTLIHSQRVVVSARRAQGLNVSAIRMKHDLSDYGSRFQMGTKDVKVLQPFNRSILERTLPA